MYPSIKGILIAIFDNSKVCITSDTIMIATVLCHVMRKKCEGGMKYK